MDDEHPEVVVEPHKVANVPLSLLGEIVVPSLELCVRKSVMDKVAGLREAVTAMFGEEFDERR